MLAANVAAYTKAEGKAPASLADVEGPRSDPWDTKYELVTVDGKLAVRSAGEDAELDTADDITRVID